MAEAESDSVPTTLDELAGAVAQGRPLEYQRPTAVRGGWLEDMAAAIVVGGVIVGANAV